MRRKLRRSCLAEAGHGTSPPTTPDVRGTLSSEQRSDVRGTEVPEASPRGTYRVISEALRKRIEEGEITGPLPSEAELMRTHSVARNTIRRALKVLEAEGVLESVPGIGWRVARGDDRRSLAERMTDVIAEDSLTIGDRYPSEAKLCDRFGVSRTAVRRVLAQMEGTGMLATAHGKGRTVCALPTSAGRS